MQTDLFIISKPAPWRMPSEGAVQGARLLVLSVKPPLSWRLGAEAWLHQGELQAGFLCTFSLSQVLQLPGKCGSGKPGESRTARKGLISKHNSCSQSRECHHFEICFLASYRDFYCQFVSWKCFQDFLPKDSLMVAFTYYVVFLCQACHASTPRKHATQACQPSIRDLTEAHSNPRDRQYHLHFIGWALTK